MVRQLTTVYRVSAIDEQPIVARASAANVSTDRRLTILRRVAVSIWLVVVVYRTATSGLAFNRELLLLYICTGLVAASIGRRKVLYVVRDWLPFALILVLYDFSRGAADLVGRPTLWQFQAEADRWMFFGVAPTVWLQEHLKLPNPPWWEVVISTTYMSFFVVPYVLAGVLWLRNREEWKKFAWFFVALSFTALVFFAFTPAAPPWAAARCTSTDVVGGPAAPRCMSAPESRLPDGGVLGAMTGSQPGAHDWVERISTRGWAKLHLDSARSLIDEGQASVNQVAAIPSLHAGLSVAITIFLWRRVRRRWRPLLVAYPLIMAFALVYSAEHYVVDILLGWALAAIVAWVLNKIWAWRSSADPA
ncbi:phosphatase PAP2 family protein [soil metagenome]